MKCQIDQKHHFRHLLLFYFNRSNKVAEAVKEICGVYGKNVLAWTTAKYWYNKFKNGIFNLQDDPHTGRPSNFDDNRLIQLVKTDGRQTCRELSQKMKSNPMAVHRHLKSNGFSQKIGSIVPYRLNEKIKEARLKIAAQNLTRHRSTHGHKTRFLHRIITSDEKWCLYTNLKHRKEWVAPDCTGSPRIKPELHPKKIMICVWWNWAGMIHWEMVPKNKTVDKFLYIDQLRRVNDIIKAKYQYRREKVILLHDNARPHTANITKTTLQELDWEVLPHPPYSPDLAPTDFHLFRSLSNHMKGITFQNEDDLKMWITNFFKSKSSNFWNKGFDKLVERWEKVLNNDGNYVIE